MKKFNAIALRRVAAEIQTELGRLYPTAHQALLEESNRFLAFLNDLILAVESTK